MAEPRDEALRLIRAHVAAAHALLEALAGPPPPAPPDEPPGLRCPWCGEEKEEQLEDTTYAADGSLVPRRTCLSCGRSFSPPPPAAGEEEHRG